MPILYRFTRPRLPSAAAAIHVCHQPFISYFVMTFRFRSSSDAHIIITYASEDICFIMFLIRDADSCRYWRPPRFRPSPAVPPIQIRPSSRSAFMTIRLTPLRRERHAMPAIYAAAPVVASVRKRRAIRRSE